LRGAGIAEREMRVIESETCVADVEVETTAIIEMLRVDSERVRLAVVRSRVLESSKGVL
jgi:hypothetical protein